MKNYRLGLSTKASPKVATILDNIKLVRKLKIDFLELVIDSDNFNVLRDYHSVRAWLYNSGVSIATLAYEVDIFDVDKFSVMLEFAMHVGIQIVQLAIPSAISLEEQNAIKKHLEQLVGLAAAQGIIIGLKTTKEGKYNSIENIMYYINEIKNPYLELYPNLGDLTNSAYLNKTDVLKDLKKGVGHICAVQLKETLPHVYKYLSFGEGHLDVNRLVSELLKDRVGIYTIEVFNTGSNDFEKKISETYDNIKNKINDIVLVSYGNKN